MKRSLPLLYRRYFATKCQSASKAHALRRTEECSMHDDTFRMNSILPFEHWLLILMSCVMIADISIRY